MTPGRAWWFLQRDWQRGFRTAYLDYFVTPKIRTWVHPCPDRPLEAVPVHVLTGAKDHRLAAWMMASFTHFTCRRWRVTWHDDGTLPPEAAATLLRLFPGSTLLPRAAADEAMKKALAPFPQAAAYRRQLALGMKIFDIPALETAERFILLDSDVLFFQTPQEILAWVDGAPRRCLFNEDIAEASNIPAQEAIRLTGSPLTPRVNSGLCLLWRDACPLEFSERCLAESSVLAGHPWLAEQTLFALGATRFGAALLPRTYEVSLGPWATPGVIARHYVGKVRDRFYGEGISRLAPILVPKIKAL